MEISVNNMVDIQEASEEQTFIYQTVRVVKSKAEQDLALFVDLIQAMLVEDGMGTLFLRMVGTCQPVYQWYHPSRMVQYIQVIHM